MKTIRITNVDAEKYIKLQIIAKALQRPLRKIVSEEIEDIFKNNADVKAYKERMLKC